MMIDCPFCSIPKNDDERILARDEHCYLLDNPEGALAHGMLIIPFRHVESPFDLTSEEWNSLQPLLNEASRFLARHKPDGFNIGWNVGEVGGQEVFHTHLHVFARFADEPFGGDGIRKWFKSASNARPEE